MTDVMISTFTLSAFHSCQVTYHLALHMVFTFHSLSDIQDATHFMMTLDIAINSQWTDSFLRVNRLRNSFQKCYGRYPDLVAKYQKSVRDILNDSLPF